MAEIVERACKLCMLCQKCSRMKVSARGQFFRRLNSAPASPMAQLLSDSVGKENVVSRLARIPSEGSMKESALLLSPSGKVRVDDQDPNSQDSGCSEDAFQVRFAVPSGFAPRKGVDPSPGKSWLSDNAVSPRHTAPSSSPVSYRVRSMRSLSFCSNDSFDDGFSELPDLDKPDENVPASLGNLLTAPILSSKIADCDTPPTSQRLPIRRAFSLVENTNESNNANKISSKRPMEVISGGVLKRRKASLTVEAPSVRHKLQRSVSENCATLLSSTYGRADLIGDFSRPYALPFVAGKLSDLTYIHADTLAAVIRGDYSSTVRAYTIIDCRYPYEFEGGHIRGATNLYTCEQVEAALLKGNTLEPTCESGESSGRDILIFHCEFSVCRGPSMYRWLRRLDRNSNKSCYPTLQYPEVYVLSGGYKAFHQSYPSMCDPIGYTPMQDPGHDADLRKFRTKSSSWTASRASFKRLQLL